MNADNWHDLDYQFMVATWTPDTWPGTCWCTCYGFNPSDCQASAGVASLLAILAVPCVVQVMRLFWAMPLLLQR